MPARNSGRGATRRRVWQDEGTAAMAPHGGECGRTAPKCPGTQAPASPFQDPKSGQGPILPARHREEE